MLRDWIREVNPRCEESNNQPRNIQIGKTGAEHVFGSQRYIELNPVRADMVAHPGDYFWSGYGYNAQGQK